MNLFFLFIDDRSYNEPSVAQAAPSGLAIAGVGGVASSQVSTDISVAFINVLTGLTGVFLLHPLSPQQLPSLETEESHLPAQRPLR